MEVQNAHTQIEFDPGKCFHDHEVRLKPSNTITVARQTRYVVAI